MRTYICMFFCITLVLSLSLWHMVRIESVPALTAQEEKGESLTEEMLIKEAVEGLYIKGLVVRDFDLIRAVCIPETRSMSAGKDSTLHVTTLEKWSKRFDPHDPPFKQLDYTILKIDREGAAAQVKILFLVDSKHHVTDFLHMLKLDGKWRIVNIMNS